MKVVFVFASIDYSNLLCIYSCLYSDILLDKDQANIYNDKLNNIKYMIFYFLTLCFGKTNAILVDFLKLLYIINF